MPLSAGDKLGPYEILGPIGAGGMGEVYRARDPRLNRDVALKVSFEQFSERSEREARAVAALNHPNICQLYDIGPNYFVMELIDGVTPRGPMPLEEALAITRQIAAALQSAHERGIIHRDLKPANIKVTASGAVKVLDFGLAQTSPQAAAAGSSAADSPTFTMGMTRAGAIVGTAAYMAPEQARGKAVDKRGDIWAFGVVLFELLTGRQLFQGSDVTEILAGVVKDTPDLGRVPRQVRRLLASCLEKNPEKRLRDIGDAWLLLEESPPDALPVRSPKWPLVGAGVVAAALAVAAITAWLRPVPSARIPSLFFTITLPPDLPIVRPAIIASEALIAPDGSAVVVRAAKGLYFRRLDSPDFQPVPGSTAPFGESFWSPDSSTVVFPDRTLSSLIKVRLPDGAPVQIAPVNGPSRGGTWSQSGTILFSGGLHGLSSVPASGGEWKKVSGLPPGGVLYPEFLPASDDFIFLLNPGPSSTGIGGIYLASYRNGAAVNPVLLLRGTTEAHYTPAGGGRLLFIRDDNLYSQQLDLRQKKLVGESALVASDVASFAGADNGTADFSVTRNGTVVWRPGGAATAQLTVFDRQGNVIGTAGPRGLYSTLKLSPDDQRVLVGGEGEQSLIEPGKPAAFNVPPSADWSSWISSGGGLRLIGFDRKPGDVKILTMPGDGSGEPQTIAQLSVPSLPGYLSDVSSDGSNALIANPETNSRIHPAVLLLDLRPDARHNPVTLVSSDKAAFHASFSPDGSWMFYLLGVDLIAQPVSPTGERRQIATNVSFPVWRGDGKEILSLGPQGVTSIAVEKAGADLRFGPTRVLFSGAGPGLRFAPGVVTRSSPFAESRDGSRIFWLQGRDMPESNVIYVKTGAIR